MGDRTAAQGTTLLTLGNLTSSEFTNSQNQDFGGVHPVRTWRCFYSNNPDFSPSFTLPWRRSPRTPESTPNPSLQSTQNQTKAVHSTCSTHVTCIVPNKQFCPNKCMGQYTQHKKCHYISPPSVVVCFWEQNAHTSTSSNPSACVAVELIASTEFQT